MDRQTIINDLVARIPYGVVVNCTDGDVQPISVDFEMGYDNPEFWHDGSGSNINFEDYYTNDSEIESKNHFEILKFSKYGLIVNDENNLLEREDIDFAFYNLVKQLYNREDSFISTYTDEVSKIVASMLSERGYKVVHRIQKRGKRRCF